MNYNDKIIQILAEKPGLKTKEIARLLGITRREVNSALYSTLVSKVVQDGCYRWWLKTTAGESKASEPTQNLSMPHTPYDLRRPSWDMNPNR